MVGLVDAPEGLNPGTTDILSLQNSLCQCVCVYTSMCVILCIAGSVPKGL